MSRCTTMRQMSTSCLNILHTLTAHASATVNTIANQSQSCDLVLQLMLLPLHPQVSYASDASVFRTDEHLLQKMSQVLIPLCNCNNAGSRVHKVIYLIIIDENRYMGLPCHLLAVLHRELSRIGHAVGSVCKRCYLLWTRTREMSAYVTLGYRIFDFRI